MKQSSVVRVDLGAGGPTPSASPSTDVDVVIVGAGAAGIGAARTLLSYGRSVVVLEAQGYAGGRACSDNTTFSEIPFDLGAQLFQQVLAGNVLYQTALARGNAVADMTAFPTAFFFGKRPPSDPEVQIAAAEMVSTTAAMLTALIAAGASILTPAQDVAVSTVTDAFENDPYYANAISLNVESITGAPPSESSLLDLFAFLSVSPAPFVIPGDSYFIKGGMGNFIAGLADGLPLQLNTPVQRIAYDSSGVTVHTKSAAYRAKAVIVTASTAVLAADGIDFAPLLPAPVREAIAAIPLGHIYKAALGFKSDIFAQLKTVTEFNTMTLTTPLGGPPGPTYFAKFWDTNVVEFLADADLAVTLEGMTATGQRDYLLGQLELNGIPASSAFDGRMTASSWGTNQYTQGAYSHANIGSVDARTALRAGVRGQIFFAGESFTLGGLHSSLHGAYTSGISAANAALRALGVAAEHGVSAAAD
ncbi:MAG: amine oxidase [Candidatus Eremiobacteraeota bacterium]|nr:amine oxidase [Candidatus Eremiobacteraeota bacterium]